MWGFLKKLFGFIFILVLMIVAALGISYSIEGYTLYREALEAYPLEEMAADIRADTDYIELPQLPQRYLDAVIACEDHRFYRHPGVDVLAIGRALWHDVQALEFVEGGSTITQQLAKNQYFTLEKLVPRKVADALMALEMERWFSKDEILELYVNSIFFGETYYGIGEASRGYFQKEPEHLNDYECTMLAGIPNAPSAYALTENPELAHRRQRAVIALMIKRGFLSPMEAEAITAVGQQMLSWASSSRSDTAIAIIALDPALRQEDAKRVVSRDYDGYTRSLARRKASMMPFVDRASFSFTMKDLMSIYSTQRLLELCF